MGEPLFVSVEEAARRIGIGQRLAYPLCRVFEAGESGGLRCVRLVRRLLVPVWAIEQLGRNSGDPRDPPRR
jgi:hypothetical protein